MPPVHSDHGVDLRVGANVFVNHGCTLNDMGGIEIGDDTMLGPNVSLITSGHPTAVAERRAGIVVAPIAIGANVWIGAGATVLGGVSVGDGAVDSRRGRRDPRCPTRPRWSAGYPHECCARWTDFQRLIMCVMETRNEEEPSDAAVSLARAFHRDAMFTYILPDAEKRERVLPWFFGAAMKLGLRRGEVHESPAGSGAAVWLVPATRTSARPTSCAPAWRWLPRSSAPRPFGAS